MSKQNRGLMTTQTNQTNKNLETQKEFDEFIDPLIEEVKRDQEYETLDLKNMVETIANDYAEMYNSVPNPIKDVLNQLLMFGEGEGVLVATAIKQLWEINQEYKEGN
jgi:hypothetical protein